VSRTLVTLLLLFGGRGLAAQAPDSLPAQPGSEFTISVLTAGVGEQVWERWGHNMIRVQDRLTGEDLAYNWGMFSFQQEGFVRRFLMGRMEYWMAPIPMAATYRQYSRTDRTLIDQTLDLTPAEKVELVAFLRWNAQEESKYYRYDYYNDNCSTRLRDALDRALGGALNRATQADAGTTFREESRRLSAGDLPLYTGLMLGLGAPTDRPISIWEEMFLPVRMMERIREVSVPATDSTTRRLVVAEDTLYLSSRFSEPAATPQKTTLYLAIGLGIGGMLLLLGWAKQRGLFLVVGALVALVLGLGGLLLLFLMGFTDHAVTYGNENALLVSFLALLLAVVLRPALAGRPQAERLATALALAVAGTALAAVLIKVTPWGHQDTWETIALLLPIDLGLAAGTILAIGGPRWRPPVGQ
jgi:hypothetical protein